MRLNASTFCLRVCLFGVCSAGLWASKPLSRTDPVHLWLDQLGSKSPLARLRAVHAPGNVDARRPAASAAIVQAAASRNILVRSAAIDAIGEFGLDPPHNSAVLLSALADADPGVRAHAAVALSKIAQPALPALLAAFDRPAVPGAQESAPSVKAYLTFVLSRSEESAGALIDARLRQARRFDAYDVFIARARPQGAVIPVLRRLRSGDADLQLSAMAAARQLSPGPEILTPGLLALLRSGSPRGRREAAELLGSTRREAAVPGLSDALESEDPLLRAAAAEALGNIGASSAPAASRLADLILNDPAGQVRSAAASALAKIGAGGKITCSKLTAAVTRDGGARALLLYVMGLVCMDDDAAINAVAGAVDASDPASSNTAIAALGVMGPKAAPFLIEQLTSGTRDSRISAATALGLATAPSDHVITALAQAIGDRDAGVRAAAVSAVGNLGKAAAGAWPALVAAYREGTVDRLTIVEAIGKIAPDNRLALDVIGEGMRDRRLRAAAFSAAVRIGAPAVPILAESLESLPVDARDLPLQALSRLGPLAAPASTALVRILVSDTDNMRDAARALAAIGDAAIPALAALTRDANPGRRLAVAEVLRASDEDQFSPASLSVLADPLLSDADARIRLAAVQALAPRPAARPLLARLQSDPDAEVRRAVSAATPDENRAAAECIRKLRDKNVPASTRADAASKLVNYPNASAESIAALRAVLTDSDESVVRAALRALVELDPSAIDDPAARAVMIEDRVIREVGDEILRIQLMAGERQTQRDLRTDSGFQLPVLPWPVLRPSRLDVIDATLLGGDAQTLGQLYTRLSGVLAHAGFKENGIFSAPGGFALVTAVERFRSDGTSYTEPDRWTKSKLPLTSWRLQEYLGSLFFDHPGDFRMFMFVVTDRNVTMRGERASEDKARQLSMEGGKVLPDSIAGIPFKGHACYVLVYHFEHKVGGDVALLNPSPLSIEAHLSRAGLKFALN